jgi:hypothetical protein
LLSFSAESFVFQFATQKYEEQGIHNYSFAVVLCGCKTWSLTLSEERRLMVFEIRVLRRIFGPKSGEVTEELRKLHNDELGDVSCSPNIIRLFKSRRMRLAGHVARITDLIKLNLRYGSSLKGVGNLCS